MMRILESVKEFPVLGVIGFVIFIGFYFGKNMRYLKLPAIIGYMILGALLGPSFLHIFNDKLLDKLDFIPDLALGFVALSIGMELKLSTMKKLGKSIIYIILLESFGAFIMVGLAVYILTGNMPLSIIFASVAPASAPAGTVAVIKEYKARGSLTQALYAVVGFDDGLGIIIFGFALAVAKDILLTQTGDSSGNMLLTLFYPFKEIIISFLLGGFLAFIFSLVTKKMKDANNIFILITGLVMATIGLCEVLHLSLILTNMIIGMVLVNTQRTSLLGKINEKLSTFLPLLFLLFFSLAGAELHIKALPSLGIVGIVYFFARSIGLIGGARLGAILGGAEDKIRKYLGLGILSQAGVAIGLTLMVKQEFEGLGKTIKVINGSNFTTGDFIGTSLITIVTATSILFEIVGPITTKIALKKAGEIKED